MTFDPRFMSWDRWSSETKAAHLTNGTLPQGVPEERWQDWASMALAIPANAQRQIPQPQFFASWRDWAYRFNEYVVLAEQ